MPRYSFHVWDGSFFEDPCGEVLPDEAAARLRAETIAYELAGESKAGAIIVTNRDIGGKTVFTIPLQAERCLH
jgi:hypothetical protein